MIHLKAFINKSNIKQIIVFFLLFTTIIIFICLLKNIKISYTKEKESKEYRTTYITFIENYNPENILNDFKIEKYLYEDDIYVVLFKQTSYIKEFKTENNSIINTFASQNFNDTNIIISKTIINILLSISIIIMSTLIFLFSMNYIYNIEKDVALYKLLGYSNNKIIELLITYMLLLYLTIYLISTITSLLITKYIIKITFINTFETILIYIVISLIVLISFIRIINKVKKISPITLISSY